jgi:aspartate racemase
MKTIGVLGGLGPQATMEFERLFHESAQRLIPQNLNEGFPPMVVVYVRHSPVSRGWDGATVMPLQPDGRLLEAASRLGQWADFIVITANMPHLFQAELEEAAGRPILSLIDLVLQEIERRRLRRVGVLGFGMPQVYLDVLNGSEVEVLTLEEDQRARLDQVIISLMEGRPNPLAGQIIEVMIDALRDRGSQVVILGSTEIPLLLADRDAYSDLIDPAALLAEAAVRMALE